MNTKQLITFREVMLTGSISEAARNLYRTQPAVSSQINNLESAIGLKLFERKDGRLHPLPEAHFLLSEANEVLNRLSSIEQSLAKVRNLESGTIHVVAMPGPSVFLIPELVSEFVQDKPDVNVSMIARSSFKVQQLISAQRYDIGLADLDPVEQPSSSLINNDILHYQCFCALHIDDPLARKKFICAADLDGKPMATLIETHPAYTQIKKIFEDEKLQFNRRFETQYFIPLFTFVEQKLAYAIVDPLSIRSYQLYRKNNQTITFVPFKPEINFSISLVTPLHRPLSNIANAFTQFLKGKLLDLKNPTIY